MDTTLMVGESCSYLILGHGRSRTALVLQYRAAIVHAVLHSLDNIISLHANFKKIHYSSYISLTVEILKYYLKRLRPITIAANHEIVRPT